MYHTPDLHTPKRHRMLSHMGAIQELTTLAGVKSAKELPHEFLLRIMNGEKFVEKRVSPSGEEFDVTVYPSLAMRMEAAKLAAPYTAPRLASTTVDLNASLTVIGIADRLLEAEKRIKRVS